MSTWKMKPTSLHPIAALYQCFVLDTLVEVVSAISLDFIKRPQHYQSVPENIANSLEEFRLRTGSDPEWPSAAQRAQIFAPIFGVAFRSASIDLRSAAVIFVESGTERNLIMLEDRVRDTAVSFRGYLKSLEGQAVSSANRETSSVFLSAIEVLRSEAVAGAFGLKPALGRDWPLNWAVEANAVSSDGALLIEEIQRALVLFSFQPVLSQHLVILMQRVAHYGAMTIASILENAADWNSAKWVSGLVRNVYGWEIALQSTRSEIEYTDKYLQPRVVSQVALDDEELTSLPTEEGPKRAESQLALAPGGGMRTCFTGLTCRCDISGPGDTCRSGWTVCCDDLGTSTGNTLIGWLW